MSLHKKITNAIIIFILLFMISSCSLQDSLHCKEYNNFINRFSDIAFEKYGLQYAGRGGGFLLQINRTTTSFFFPGNLPEIEAVDLLKKLTADYHKMINSDITIRPYLKTYPFPLKDINVTISFLETPGKIFSISYINRDLLISTAINSGLKVETLKHFYIYKPKELSEYSRKKRYISC